MTIMIKKTYTNTCYRCGKVRIVVRVWKEKVWNSVITNTETACPDKECQAVINKELARHKELMKKRLEGKKNRYNKRNSSIHHSIRG